jgi:hypothetical protein
MSEDLPFELLPVERHCLEAEVRGDLVTVGWFDDQLIGVHSAALQCACDPTLVARKFQASRSVRLTHDALSCSVCAQRSQVTEARWYLRNALLTKFIVAWPGDQVPVTTTVSTRPEVECVYEGVCA